MGSPGGVHGGSGSPGGCQSIPGVLGESPLGSPGGVRGFQGTLQCLGGPTGVGVSWGVSWGSQGSLGALGWGWSAYPRGPIWVKGVLGGDGGAHWGWGGPTGFEGSGGWRGAAGGSQWGWGSRGGAVRAPHSSRGCSWGLSWGPQKLQPQGTPWGGGGGGVNDPIPVSVSPHLFTAAATGDLVPGGRGVLGAGAERPPALGLGRTAADGAPAPTPPAPALPPAPPRHPPDPPRGSYGPSGGPSSPPR